MWWLEWLPGEVLLLLLLLLLVLVLVVLLLVVLLLVVSVVVAGALVLLLLRSEALREGRWILLAARVLWWVFVWTVVMLRASAGREDWASLAERACPMVAVAAADC